MAALSILLELVRFGSSPVWTWGWWRDSSSEGTRGLMGGHASELRLGRWLGFGNVQRATEKKLSSRLIKYFYIFVCLLLANRQQFCIIFICSIWITSLCHLNFSMNSNAKNCVFLLFSLVASQPSINNIYWMIAEARALAVLKSLHWVGMALWIHCDQRYFLKGAQILSSSCFLE